MMGVYDESLRKFHIESRVSLERDQEAELSRRFKESMQGQELTGIDLGDYDTPVLGNLDYAQGTLSPQYMKPFMQAIGTRDAATGESLLGPMTIKPEEPGRWSKAKKYIAGQVESVLKMYGEGALQTLGAAEDIRNHVLDTSADLVVALGGDESEVMRGKSNIPQSDSLAYSIPRDLMSFAGKYAVARGALLKTVGKPVSLWGKFGLESAAGAVADFMQDPRTDSLIDAVSSVMGEERYIAELYKESPLMARTALAGEGSVIGAAAEGVMRGIPAAVQRLATYADDLEQVGVDRMRRSRSTLNAGIDPEGLRGLVEYFTGKILKGANELTEDLRAEVMPVGATDDQVAGAFRQALEVVQLGEDRAIASPIRPDQPVELSFSEIFGGEGAAREAQDVAGGVSPIRPGQSEELGFTDIFGDTKATEDPLQESLTAWHGSPHEYDQPSLQAVGTGEGAQAYGYGYYSAENPDVAKSYMPRDFEYEEELLNQYNYASNTSQWMAADVYERAMLHETPSEMRAYFNDPENQFSKEDMAEANSAIDDVEERFQNKKASFYKLRIPKSDVDNYLDWDKPLSQQPEAVQRLFRRGDTGQFEPGYEDLTGAQIYSKGQSRFGGAKEYSDFLLSEGVPGIRYLDADSRSPASLITDSAHRAAARSFVEDGVPYEEAQQLIKSAYPNGGDSVDAALAEAYGKTFGTSNFVTFDPDRIQVISRNGKELRKNEKKRAEVLAALGATGAAMQVYDDSEAVQ